MAGASYPGIRPNHRLELDPLDTTVHPSAQSAARQTGGATCTRSTRRYRPMTCGGTRESTSVAEATNRSTCQRSGVSTCGHLRLRGLIGILERRADQHGCPRNHYRDWGGLGRHGPRKDRCWRLAQGNCTRGSRTSRSRWGRLATTRTLWPRRRPPRPRWSLATRTQDRHTVAQGYGVRKRRQRPRDGSAPGGSSYGQLDSGQARRSRWAVCSFWRKARHLHHSCGRIWSLGCPCRQIWIPIRLHGPSQRSRVHRCQQKSDELRAHRSRDGRSVRR
jgi:hypothetical protein